MGRNEDHFDQVSNLSNSYNHFQSDLNTILQTRNRSGSAQMPDLFSQQRAARFKRAQEDDKALETSLFEEGKTSELPKDQIAALSESFEELIIGNAPIREE